MQKFKLTPICSAGQYHKTRVPEMLSGVEEALGSVYKLWNWLLWRRKYYAVTKVRQFYTTPAHKLLTCTLYMRLSYHNVPHILCLKVICPDQVP